ncbi:MAG: 16S rRNA (guanine(966)-N(2))-methyltransferase RsmD [Mycoplasma sp.]
MRVISGIARGKKLVSIKGTSTRPTIDRVKENLFNIIQFNIEDRQVADLFAGSGALVIECLSRGAKKGYFVEKNLEAMDVIKDNVQNCKFDEKTIEYLLMSYERALELFNRQKIKFDIIFLDPPYILKCFEEILEKIYEYQLLNQNGIICIETFRDNKIVIDETKYKIATERNYGNVKIIVLIIKN